MIKSTDQNRADVTDRLKDLRQVEAVLKRAAREAILAHARAGLKIAVWSDGEVVWVKPTVNTDLGHLANHK